MKLSEDLEQWRTERPSEWKMDEFVRKAKAIEEICDDWFLEPMLQMYPGANGECLFCAQVERRDGTVGHSTTDCPHIQYLKLIE